MNLLHHMRRYKEQLLPLGTLRRRCYDRCRLGFRAALLRPKEVQQQYEHRSEIEELPRPIENGSLPLPPDDLCMRVGGTKGAEFISQGKFLHACLVHALPEDFSWSGKRVFDFGCGVGRVLRHFAPQAAEVEFWGSDIHEPSVNWLAKNSRGIFRIIKNDPEPTLPFPSNYFDLIYSVSVFTHVYKGWDRWLREIKRILAPSGQFLCTFHSRKAFEWIIGKPFDENSVGMKVFFKKRSWDSGGPQIFHSDGWVIKNWGKVLPVTTIIKEGLVDWQSIAIMEKRDDRPSEVRFLQPFPYSRVNPNFSGNLDYDPLAPRSWLREHGSCFREKAELSGWFSSGKGEINGIYFLVDDQPMEPLSIEKYAGITAHTCRPQVSFKAILGTGHLSEGSHRGIVSATDTTGGKHWIEFVLFRKEASRNRAFHSAG